MANAKGDILSDYDTKNRSLGHQEGIRFEKMGKIKVKGKAKEIDIFRPRVDDSQVDTLGQPDTPQLVGCACDALCELCK